MKQTNQPKQASTYYIEKINSHFLNNRTAKSRNWLSVEYKIPRNQVHLVIEQGIKEGLLIAGPKGVIERTPKLEKRFILNSEQINRVTNKITPQALKKLKGKGVMSLNAGLELLMPEAIQVGSDEAKAGADKGTFSFCVGAFIRARKHAGASWDDIENELVEIVDELKKQENPRKKFKRVKKPV